MTNAEILQKAIEKANRNAGKELFQERSIFGWEAHDVEWLIFSHDFAKAFWGEDPLNIDEEPGEGLDVWQYHLQQMVLEENPLQYLEKYLWNLK